MKSKDDLVQDIYKNTKSSVLDHYFRLIMNGGEGGTFVQKKSSLDLRMRKKKI